MIKVTLISLASLSLVLTSLAADADIRRGKTLHDENCTRCHDSSVYTRPNHRVTDLDMLNQQVHRCRDSQGFTWPEDQVSDVVHYLNNTYYHFGDAKTTK